MTSALIGLGQSVAAVLALLPILLPDAAVPRFVSHGAVVAFVLQAIGALAALAGRAPADTAAWAARSVSMALTLVLIWAAGDQESFPLFLGVMLLAAHVAAGRWGFLLETSVALSLVTAISGVAHPLMVPVLAPICLALAVGGTVIRVVRWSLPAFGATRRDLATLSVVTSLFAPVVMLAGGWRGHDNALLFSAALTQFVGLTVGRRVSHDLIAG